MGEERGTRAIRSMQLYLVRHAIAAERGIGNAVDDFSRSLTAEGMEKMRLHATVLRRMGVETDMIWTSPLLRARQTAELLAEGLRTHAPIEVEDALRPDRDPGDVLAAVESRGRGNLALVGHEPQLGELASRLLTGRRSDVVQMKKGGVACFELDGSAAPLSARLRWLLTPKAMAMMS